MKLRDMQTIKDFFMERVEGCKGVAIWLGKDYDEEGDNWGDQDFFSIKVFVGDDYISASLEFTEDNMNFDLEELLMSINSQYQQVMLQQEEQYEVVEDEESGVTEYYSDLPKQEVSVEDVLEDWNYGVNVKVIH